MQVFHQLSEVENIERAAVAIGNFDGCHLGHQQLLKGVVGAASSSGATPTVLTFFPHPAEVLRPGQPLKRLTTASEKLLLLEDLGIRAVLVAKFDREVARLSPRDFFQRYLVNGLRAKSVHVGNNFLFGHNREGNTQLLGKLCEEQEIALNVVPAYLQDEVRVSSTNIRKLISVGDVAKAALQLGCPYQIQGQVVEGDRRGRELGFSTANLRFAKEKVVPNFGVYVTRAVWQKQSFACVTNVGIRPTFKHQGDDEPSVQIETHILDFDSEIYDEFLQLQFLEKIREEKKFDSIDSLKQQIQRDVEFTVNYFQQRRT